ncbi:MAG: YfhO family protein, partial [Clostridia bacterium]|nr:YfhO family protein [Clostridia bacterium]
YDEGWVVRVDGRECAVTPVLGDSLLAVRIPAGKHEIEFEYDPACVRQGLAISASGLAVFALCCVFETKLPTKRKKRTP